MAGTKTFFETKDINLAAFLKGVKGYEITDVIEADGRVIFVFADKDSKKRKADVLKFYNDEGGHLSYTNAWKDLKNMLHNVKKDT